MGRERGGEAGRCWRPPSLPFTEVSASDSRYPPRSLDFPPMPSRLGGSLFASFPMWLARLLRRVWRHLQCSRPGGPRPLVCPPRGSIHLRHAAGLVLTRRGGVRPRRGFRVGAVRRADTRRPGSLPLCLPTCARWCSCGKMGEYALWMSPSADPMVAQLRLLAGARHQLLRCGSGFARLRRERS
jgi:hypothetical protein